MIINVYMHTRSLARSLARARRRNINPKQTIFEFIYIYIYIYVRAPQNLEQDMIAALDLVRVAIILYIM